MSVLERCLSYKESNKGNKQRQGITLGVRFTEVCVKRESRPYTVPIIGHLWKFLKKAYSIFETVFLVGLFMLLVTAISAGSTGSILDRIDCIIYLV